MSFLVNGGGLGVGTDELPEVAAALVVMLLLLFGEAEFGVEHVVGVYETAEGRGKCRAHLDVGSCFWVCEAVGRLLRGQGWSKI